MRSTHEVHAALEQLLGHPVESVRSEPYPYGTSCALDALDVRVPDGSLIRLLLKDLGRASDEARSVKPPSCTIRSGRSTSTVKSWPRAVWGPRITTGASSTGAEAGIGYSWSTSRDLSCGRSASYRSGSRPRGGWRRCTRAAGTSRIPRLLRFDRVFYEQWLERALALNNDPRLRVIADGFPGGRRTAAGTAEHADPQ